VSDLLRLFNRGIDATLRLLACPSVADLDPSMLRLPSCHCTT
jgi:hypothetical protein